MKIKSFRKQERVKATTMKDIKSRASACVSVAPSLSSILFEGRGGGGLLYPFYTRFKAETASNTLGRHIPMWVI